MEAGSSASLTIKLEEIRRSPLSDFTLRQNVSFFSVGTEILEQEGMFSGSWLFLITYNSNNLRILFMESACTVVMLQVLSKISIYMPLKIPNSLCRQHMQNIPCCSVLGLLVAYCLGCF